MNKIIVFVKAPVPGKVKTRLCPPLSEEQASRFYKAFAQDTLELAEKVSEAAVEVAYEPGGEFKNIDWMRARPPVFNFSQQGRDLGERLAHAFKESFSGTAEKVVIIGSDTPHLSPGMIEMALLSLNRKDAVLGPAEDGGYYLIGLRKPCPKLFQKIPWSTNKVFRETVKRAMELDLGLDTLPMFADIDTFSDLIRLAQELQALTAEACPATRRAMKYVLRPELKDESFAI